MRPLRLATLLVLSSPALAPAGTGALAQMEGNASAPQEENLPGESVGTKESVAPETTAPAVDEGEPSAEPTAAPKRKSKRRPAPHAKASLAPSTSTSADAGAAARPVSSQEPPDVAPHPSAPPTPVAPSAAPSQPLAVPGKSTPEQDQALTVARTFFTDLLAQDTEGAAAVCGIPFQLESRHITGREELAQEWARQLHDKRTDLLTLYGIEILSPRDMEKRYGKPPARLGGFPYQEGKSYVAVANVSGRAAVAVLKQGDKGFRVVAFTD